MPRGSALVNISIIQVCSIYSLGCMHRKLSHRKVGSSYNYNNFIGCNFMANQATGLVWFAYYPEFALNFL